MPVLDYQKITHRHLHPNNRHQGRYDLARLVKAFPALTTHIILNPRGEQTINFTEPQAVKCLNQAILAADYGIAFWDIPSQFLCPPIPGRVDYIHHLAALLAEEKAQDKATMVQVLDIGVGANCIYPILGVREYQWRYVGSDVSSASLKVAKLIVANNPALKGRIELRLQADIQQIFNGIIHADERYHFSSCNPPFHRSADEAMSGSQRKLQNLAKNQLKRRGQIVASQGRHTPPSSTLNFGGQSNELWCEGGEASFLKRMAQESRDYAAQVLWFTTLVSKKENLKPLQQQLAKLGVQAVREIEMHQGQKITRILAWSYMNADARQQWLTVE